MTKHVLLKPDRFRPGDAIGILAPTLPIYDEQSHARGVGVLREMGFRVEVGPNVVVRPENEPRRKIAQPRS